MMHRYCRLLLLLLLLLRIIPGTAQKGIQFHGSNRLSFNYASAQGYASQIPQSYFTNNFAATLSLWEIPVSFSSRYSTAPAGKDIFQYSIKTHPAQYLSGLVSGRTNFFRRLPGIIETLEIGNAHPRYGALILENISVRGLNIILTPGPLYMAFCKGTATHELHTFQRTSVAVPKTELTLAAIGVGKRNSSHLHFTLLQGKDKSLQTEPGVRLRENLVVGTETGFAFFNKRWITTFQATLSLFTRDRNAPGVEDLLPANLRVPGDLISLNISTQGDIAFRGSTHLKLKNTDFQGQICRTGAGYHTLGNPYLRNDLFLAHVKLSQKFFKKKASLTAFYKHSYDDLSGWKDYRTTAQSAGITAAWRAPQQPWFVVTFAPMTQYGDHSSVAIKLITSHISLLSGYNFSIKNIRLASTAGYTRLLSEQRFDSAFFNLLSNTFMLSQNIRFSALLSLTGSVTLSFKNIRESEQQINTYNLQAEYGKYNGWKNRLRITWASYRDRGEKLRLRYSSTFPVTKWLKGEVSISRNDNFGFSGAVRPQDEWIILTTLICTW